ncbi:MAG: ABC-2 family transporter protein [Chloroflexota bacterium]|nr:ABC-2 family transporter protein [Chloroflexota bacterium]
MRGLRLAAVFFRVNAMNELQYRANLVVQVFESGVALVTGLAVLGLVYSHTNQLAGWGPSELLAVMGVHILMGGVIGAAIQPNMTRLMEDIREGTFDFVLTKPEDAQVLSSVREFQVWRTVDVVIGAIVLATAIAQLQGGAARAIGPAEALAFVAALLLGASMIYCFWLILTIGAFWIVRVDQIAELFEGIYQSGRWPVSVYPGWLRIGLTFLVPIAFAITVPAEALTGRLTPETLGVAAVFAVVLLTITRALWRLGLRNYSGASA